MLGVFRKWDLEVTPEMIEFVKESFMHITNSTVKNIADEDFPREDLIGAIQDEETQFQMLFLEKFSIPYSQVSMPYEEFLIFQEELKRNMSNKKEGNE